MLASLLPGLRDVRTPLAVGYVWFLNLWLVVGNEISERLKVSDGFASRFVTLNQFLGQGAMIAGLSFAAFLFGSLVTIRSDSLPVLWGRLTNRKLQEYEPALLQAVTRALGRRGVDSLEAVASAELFPVDDFRARLLVANQEMYGEFDRFESEAVFRINVSFPVMVFGGLVAFGSGVPWWSSILIVLTTGLLVGMLFAQGQVKSQLADEVLVRSVASGIIEHPVVERAHLVHEARMRKVLEGQEAERRQMDMEADAKRQIVRSDAKRQGLLSSLDMLEMTHENLRVANELAASAPPDSAEKTEHIERGKYWRRQIQEFRQDVLRHFDED